MLANIAELKSVNGRYSRECQSLVRKYNWLATSRINITLDKHRAILLGMSPLLLDRTWVVSYASLPFLVTFVGWLTLADATCAWGLIMRRFQCAALAAVAVIGFASMASAADLPVKAPVAAPAYSWTGCYIGGNLGGGWTHKEFHFRAEDEGTLNVGGFVGGGQVGCDYQFASNWLIGVQGMFDGTTIKGTDIDPTG